MGTVNIRLRYEKQKPTIELKTAIGIRSALIDTGAHMVIRFCSEDEFPDAVDVKKYAIVGGLGGCDEHYCPVFCIPQMIFDDMDTNEKFTIYNLPVVIYDVSKDYGYDFLIGGTIFSKVDYSIFNMTKIRHFQINFSKDINCSLAIKVDSKSNPIIVNDRKILQAVITFFQEENQDIEEIEMQTSANNDFLRSRQKR